MINLFFTNRTIAKTQKLHTGAIAVFFVRCYGWSRLRSTDQLTNKKKPPPNSAFAFSLLPLVCPSSFPIDSVLRTLIYGSLLSASMATTRNGGKGGVAIPASRLHQFAQKLRSPSILFPETYTRIDPNGFTLSVRSGSQPLIRVTVVLGASLDTSIPRPPVLQCSPAIRDLALRACSSTALYRIIGRQKTPFLLL